MKEAGPLQTTGSVIGKERLLKRKIDRREGKELFSGNAASCRWELTEKNQGRISAEGRFSWAQSARLESQRERRFSRIKPAALPAEVVFIRGGH